MKKRITYILTTAVLAGTAFLIGRNGAEIPATEAQVAEIPAGYINIYDIKGWETWESADEVGLEISGYEITKEPYTVNATVEKID